LNPAGGLFEIAEGAKRLKIQTDITPLEQQLQKALSQNDLTLENFQNAQKLNAQIQALKAQL
jgi:hypothetical protein